MLMIRTNVGTDVVESEPVSGLMLIIRTSVGTDADDQNKCRDWCWWSEPMSGLMLMIRTNVGTDVDYQNQCRDWCWWSGPVSGLMLMCSAFGISKDPTSFKTQPLLVDSLINLSQPASSSDAVPLPLSRLAPAHFCLSTGKRHAKLQTATLILSDYNLWLCNRMLRWRFLLVHKGQFLERSEAEWMWVETIVRQKRHDSVAEKLVHVWFLYLYVVNKEQRLVNHHQSCWQTDDNYNIVLSKTWFLGVSFNLDCPSHIWVRTPQR